jgi:hypothetical protein
MGKIIRHTNLADTEEPGARADVDLPQEDFEFEAQLPLVKFKVKTRTTTRSPLGAAMTTVPLVVSGCACVGTVAAIGAPTWMAVSSLLLPFAYFRSLAYLPRRRRSRG